MIIPSLPSKSRVVRHTVLMLINKADAGTNYESNPPGRGERESENCSPRQFCYSTHKAVCGGI